MKEMTITEILQMAVDSYRISADAFEEKYLFQIEAPEYIEKSKFTIPGWVKTAERALEKLKVKSFNEPKCSG